MWKVWCGVLALAALLALADAQGGVSNCTPTCTGDKVECRAFECACKPGYTRDKDVSSSDTTCTETHEFERHPEDGWYNNLIHPDWGAIDTILLRRSKTAYSDGVYEPSGLDRPNPFDISDRAHGGPSGEPSARQRNALLVFFGQQLVEEILDAQRPGCPREFFNIPVPVNHPYNKDKLTNLAMPFLRTRFDQRTGYSPNNPRQQLNEITPYIDGNLMYGAGKAWSDAIRALDGSGKLAAQDSSASVKDSLPKENNIRLPMANPPSPRDHVLRPVNRFYRLGNPRGNENPFLLSFGVVWFRYHNYWAQRLKDLHGDWGEERLFDEARKRVIAQYQKIVWYEWLPDWLGNHFDDTDYPYYCNTTDINNNTCKETGRASKSPYNGYDPNVHPGISQEFQAAAMRYGHTLVPAGVYLRKKNTCDALPFKMETGPSGDHSVRLCNSFWVSQEPVEAEEIGIDGLVLGMTYTFSEKEDRIIMNDLRQDVFGPLDWSRRDLAALNIQRGRDHGLPGYNDVRKAYGLEPLDWKGLIAKVIDEGETEKLTETHKFIQDLNRTIENLIRLKGLDESLDTLDVFPGGLLETTPEGPGELFRTILVDQFLRIRHGDRFWFENTDNGLFSPDDIQEILNTSFRDVLLVTTNIPENLLPHDVFKCNDTSTCDCRRPPATETNSGDFEPCTGLMHYDYFSGSEVSFAVSFLILALCVPATIGVMLLMARHREKQLAAETRRAPRKKANTETSFSATEWLGKESGERGVVVELVADRKKIMVNSTAGNKLLRMIDLRKQGQVVFYVAQDRMLDVMSVRVPEETDLILQFESGAERNECKRKLEQFLQLIRVERREEMKSTNAIYNEANTFDDRKKILEKFFCAVTLQVFRGDKGKGSRMQGLGDLDEATMHEIRNTKLTRTEFADSMGLQPSSMFVRNMFLLVDRSRDGFVSFEEFMNMFVTLANGDAKSKARMLFDMYDMKKTSQLTRKDFEKMIRAMLDLADASVDDDQRVQQLIQGMFTQAGLADKSTMTFDDFCKIFASEEHGEILKNATIGLAVGGQTVHQPQEAGHKTSMRERRQTVVRRMQEGNKTTPRDVAKRNRQSRVTVKAQKVEYPKTPTALRLNTIVRYVENNRLQIFWVCLYTLVLFGIFIERAYFYSVEREHAGLRRLAGYGVSVTRGAASAQMFAYASLLVTMSRNTLTFFRETFLHRFIPFDSFHAMHKYVAFWGLLFTLMHVIGHGINLYHVCTQASSDLNCYFREYFRATHVLASFHYWAWTTMTGLTGIILTIIIIIMYVFAIEYSRRHVFQAFWNTHMLYIPLYFFLTLHGAARMVQDPLWGYFFLGPLILYVLDKLVSVGRNKVEISVKRAVLLPSAVIHLEFKKPLNFEYKSGQWVRIACLKLASGEYHPFTLTSAPHEETLSLHIRAVGPWTNNIRRVYDQSLHPDQPLPKLYLDGPFGEGHQDWYRFPVSVLVGGGIGVTPFASILKDLVFKSKLKIKFPCQKVYFIWVTRTQKAFEWMTDIIREVEKNDARQLVDVHIFITQFQQKFDLRTTMLYICERHFQRIEGQSLFTGLRATTHFGRPQFMEFLWSLAQEHPNAKEIGVFSCGPPPMTLNVERACTTLNRNDGPTYHHHFENF